MPSCIPIKILKTPTHTRNAAAHNNATDQSPPRLPPCHCQASKGKSVYIEPSNVEEEVSFDDESDSESSEQPPPSPRKSNAPDTHTVREKAQELINSLGAMTSNAHSLATDGDLECA
ncbi:hypothetical protein P691DRAFT_790265 [Macrolepiota fuliginosa MF-IS2]|uniref:Uncharacterized protein n=1 Tax=Macrolepiota fuliginosa MF-IS2 TaxID=1400762 RepID=A0A9P5X278_9AGAR|nr:hypothetical protein P691DRAFT_790265 [Macrolepiota fuliginosa MF-IS2]